MQNNTFSGLFVGQNLLTLAEADSTNNFLKEAIANSTPLPEGTVIMAESQYAGRGQQGNKWNSEPGKNLTFSILLKPSFIPLDQQFNINVAISVGIIKSLQNVLGTKARIKWPNDIYYENNKLGGVLIENMVHAGRIKNSIIGIGLNVNQVIFPDWVPNPISVKQILQKDYDLKNLLYHICDDIEAAYLMLRAGNFELLKAAYIKNMYWFNEPGLFKAGGIAFTGIIKKVEQTGQLCVESDGVSRLYNFKEIGFLNKQK